MSAEGKAHLPHLSDKKDTTTFSHEVLFLYFKQPVAVPFTKTWQTQGKNTWF